MILFQLTEKHKSYHIKDEQLTRDGFKKFMKNEDCQYSVCRFARVCNHIHCIREGCNYVLHSSGQLYSHKRKHERRDAELAFRKYHHTHKALLILKINLFLLYNKNVYTRWVRCKPNNFDNYGEQRLQQQRQFSSARVISPIAIIKSIIGRISICRRERRRRS